MYRDSGLSRARLDRLALRVETAKRRKQRRVDIDDGDPDAFQKWPAQETHEAAESDEIGALLGDEGSERVLGFGRKPRPLAEWKEDGDGNPEHSRLLQGRRVGPVGHDSEDGSIEATVPGRVDQVHGVTPPPGCEEE